MVDAGTAAFSIAGFFTFCSLAICLAAIRSAQKRGADAKEMKLMLIGMAAALPIIFLFWALVAMFSIWFTVNVMGF